MADRHRTTRFPFWLWLIRAIGVIVPRRLRSDWREEWEAELQHREALLADWHRLNWRTKLDLLRRSLGAFRDALWMQTYRWEDEMVQDVRYGLRMLLKHRGFTAIAVLTLALGIGANTALFSVLDAVMLKSLPVSRPDQLVLFYWLGGEGVIKGYRGSTEEDEATGLDSSTSLSYAAFERFRDQSQTLSSVIAFAPLGRITLIVDGQAEMADAQVVSGNYFTGLGVSPGLGRTLTPDDEKVGAEVAAVISYRYWQRRFGGDPSVIGKVIYISGAAFTIVGVTPPEFYGTLNVGSAPEVTVLMGMLAQVSSSYAQYQRSPTNWWLHVLGRLKPDASAKQAEAELTAILQGHVAEISAAAGENMIAPRIKLIAGGQGLMVQRRGFSTQFAVLMAIVGLVLLIACVNLANLLLARAASRQKELAVRAAAGASRMRLIRQLLTESLILAGSGGALGLLFAFWGKDVLLALLTSGRDEFVIDASLDWRVLGFTAVVSILTGILFGLVPALRATRLELIPMLKDIPGSSRAARSPLSKTLVVAQVAMSLVLLVGAGLFVGTLRNLYHIEAGFNPDNLLIFKVRLSRYETAQRANLYQQITERIAALPGVRAVSSSKYPLVGGYYTGRDISVPGYSPQPDEDMSISLAEVAPGFLATMEIPLLAGRELTVQDNRSAPNVAVVSQSLARRFFPDQDPLGRSFSLDGQEIQIVGVARDARYGGIREEYGPVVYLPYLQNPSGPPAEMSFAVRTLGDPAAATAAIRQAVQSIDRNLLLFEVSTQNEMIRRSFVRERLFASLSSFFGLLVLALVSIGLYGVMSYTVARRTHEIGIRMALGAEPGDVLKMVIKQGMILVLAGLALGLIGALALTRVLEGFLYQVSVTDPATFVSISLLLASVALLACFIPARRAARVEPVTALRNE